MRLIDDVIVVLFERLFSSVTKTLFYSFQMRCLSFLQGSGLFGFLDGRVSRAYY